MASTIYDYLNVIRDNATKYYQERIPLAVQENLKQIGDALSVDNNLMNEFITSIVEKIAFTKIKGLEFKNPLKNLKGENVPLGKFLEEIYINPAEGTTFKTDGNLLLQTVSPDGKTCYYSRNREQSYKVSFDESKILGAFNSELSFTEFFNTIVQSLYAGDEIDEYELMKKAVTESVEIGAVTMIDCDINKPKDIAKSIKNLSKFFTFPSSLYAGYNKVNSEKISNGEKEVVTRVDTNNQVLLIRADIETEIDFEYLASLFNIDKAKLVDMTILIDSFPSETHDIYAILCDKAAIRCHDQIFKMTDFYNSSNLTYTFWLHHTQFIYVSMLANIVAFGKLLESESELELESESELELELESESESESELESE